MPGDLGQSGYAELAAAVKLAVKRASIPYGESDVVRVRLDDWNQIVWIASRNDPPAPELYGAED